MKVLVAVTEVADVDDEFELEGDRVAGDYLSYGINEWDEYALEEAVRIAEAGDDVEVVAVTIGPERAEETIRTALAKGADRAVRVWDAPLEGKTVLDARSKATILARVIEEEAPELVLAGVQASDDAWGATGIAAAATVGFGWAAVITGLELEGSVAHVRRELEGGVEALVEVDLPAVLSVQTGINEPRYASLRGIREAQSKAIDTRSLDDLGLDAGLLDASGVELVEMFVPESSGETEFIEGSPDEQAAALAEVLRDRGVGVE